MTTLRLWFWWLVCVVTFTTLIAIAWKGIATEPFSWTSWRPWTCWMLTYIAAEIYAKWIRTPNDFRSDFARKLRAFLEGLEVQHIDTLLFFGQVGDFRSLGERMAELTRDMKRSATSEQQQQKEKEYGTADRS